MVWRRVRPGELGWKTGHQGLRGRPINLGVPPSSPKSLLTYYIHQRLTSAASLNVSPATRPSRALFLQFVIHVQEEHGWT